MPQTSELFPSPQGSKTNLSQHLGVLQGREKIALYSFSLPFLITTGTWHCSRKTTWEVLWEEAGVTGHGRTFPYTALVRYRVKKKNLATTGGRWSICSRESNHCSSSHMGPDPKFFMGGIPCGKALRLLPGPGPKHDARAGSCPSSCRGSTSGR